MLTRRDRLMRTLRGEAVDRPPVCFYELNGLDEHGDDHDPYNIYSDPSWAPLIELTRDHTDRIVMRGVWFAGADPEVPASLESVEQSEDSRGRTTVRTIRAGSRTLRSRVRRERDVNTDWAEEHLLKDADDLRAYLDLPLPGDIGTPDTRGVLEAERALGDTGIVMIDTADPLCMAAGMFSMADYTVIAMTEPELFEKLLARFATTLLARTRAVAKALPGRLWRIYGPEYASPPYLPPALFRQYVVQWDSQMIAAIHEHGGYARIHSHGNLRAIIDDIVSTGCDGIDPIEPPPQGDVALADMRTEYGKKLVLFGNLEITDIENLPTPEFTGRVRQALAEGTAGAGRGFVLMPSACPYGRKLSPLTLANYRAIVAEVARM